MYEPWTPRHLRRLSPPPPAARPKGRTSELTDAERVILAGIARKLPDFGADNIARVFNRRTDRKVSDNTVRYALVKMGWRRMTRPSSAPAEPVAPVAPDPTRYTERHRPVPPEGGYPSDLTDAEWVIIEPFLRGRRQTVLCGETTRETVNAVLYIARTGGQWRFLPHEFPRWNTVAKTYYRWVERGSWAQVNDALRKQVRIAAGKDAEPTAAILDSQSVMTTEKGGSAATMRARESTVGSDISS